MQEIFANFANIREFAKISCSWILPSYSRGLKAKPKPMFWQTRTHFKAEKVSWPKIRENFLHANCLWSKFATISCRENFLFYSTLTAPHGGLLLTLPLCWPVSTYLRGTYFRVLELAPLSMPVLNVLEMKIGIIGCNKVSGYSEFLEKAKQRKG